MDLGPSVFLFANLRDSPEGGFEPDLPSGCQFVELAAPHRKARWRLYECSLAPRDPRGWDGVSLAPPGLIDLLLQARNHPQAVTLARARVMDHLDADPPVLIPRETFAELFAGFLRDALETPSREFVLDFQPMTFDEDDT